MTKKFIFPIFAALTVTTASAQVGAPYIHDPSTLAECDGKYYTFGTGGGGLISDDGGWTWHGGAERPGGGAAPAPETEQELAHEVDYTEQMDALGRKLDEIDARIASGEVKRQDS